MMILCSDTLCVEGGGGSTIREKRGSIFVLRRPPPPPPPLQDRVKLFASLLLKDGNSLCRPLNMDKTSSSHIKTTTELVVPPSVELKLFPTRPPPFFSRGKTCPPPILGLYVWIAWHCKKVQSYHGNAIVIHKTQS